MPNYIRVKQIDQPELTGFFVDSISSQSGLLVNITSGFASKFFREETSKLLGTVIYATGNQTISGDKTFKTGSFDLLTINGQTNDGDYSARINFVDSNYGSIDVSQDGNFKLRSSAGFVNINTSAGQISTANGIYELGQTLYAYKSVGYDNANINWFNKSITFSDSLDDEGINYSNTIYHFKSGVSGYIPIDSEVVHNTGDETISGIKTFKTRPTVNGTGVFLSGESILSTQISDSTTAGRALLTAATVQAQRTALDIFVSAANLAAIQALAGNFQRIYLALDTQKTYVWNGSGYTEVSPNTHARAGAANINVGETALASAFLVGSNNTAVGASALFANRGGSNNTACGTNALMNNVAGSNNSAVGEDSLKDNNANNNSALGYHALRANVDGVNNTAVGQSALLACNSYNNTAVGQGALYQCISGNSNAGFGLIAGSTITSGIRNTLLGTQSDVDLGGRNNCVVIGANAVSPAFDGSLSIGSAMTNLTTGTAGVGATSYLRIWLNGLEYRILIQRAS
jgi:hypothetical protein